MTNTEWSIEDLQRELAPQGVSLNDIMFIDIYRQLTYDTVEEAAKNILAVLEGEKNGSHNR